MTCSVHFIPGLSSSQFVGTQGGDLSSDLDSIGSSVRFINALQIVRPGGEGGDVPSGLEVFGTISFEPERTGLGGMWLARAFVDLGVKW